MGFKYETGLYLVKNTTTGKSRRFYADTDDLAMAQGLMSLQTDRPLDEWYDDEDVVQYTLWGDHYTWPRSDLDHYVIDYLGDRMVPWADESEEMRAQEARLGIAHLQPHRQAVFPLSPGVTCRVSAVKFGMANHDRVFDETAVFLYHPGQYESYASDVPGDYWDFSLICADIARNDWDSRYVQQILDIHFPG